MNSIDSNVEVSTDLGRFATVEGSRLKFHLMPPGFVCIIKAKQDDDSAKGALELEQLIFPTDMFKEAGALVKTGHARGLVLISITRHQLASYGDR